MNALKNAPIKLIETGNEILKVIDANSKITYYEIAQLLPNDISMVCC